MIPNNGLESAPESNAQGGLHNAARSYCINRHAHWCSEYQVLIDRGVARAGNGYTDEAYDTFPRYNIMSAILTDIERFDLDALPELAELAELLILSGHTAKSVFNEKPSSAIESAAIADERQRFANAISKLASGRLPGMAMLPYRRVLSEAEVKSLWQRVEVRWATTGGYFYPLNESTEPSLAAFDATAFDKQFPPEALRAILRKWRVNRLFELREYGDDNYLLALDAWSPYYNGAEGYWFSESLDWIMYASHEDSITTGGILTDAVIKEWPEASEHPWDM